MKFDRRGFLKTAGGLAIATAASSLPTFAATEDASGKASGRIAVLYDPSFPPGEIKLLPHDEIAKALEQYHTSFITANELASALDPAKFDLFINPYGSLFPEEAAESIFTFLRAGGNWINLGGTPLSIPIIRTGGGWEKQNLQTAFYKKLGITQTFRISQAGVTSYEENDQAMMFGGIIHQFNATETYSFYYRFTNTKDFPDEDGSDGPREATLTPMVWGCNDAGIRLTAPFVQIDRISGDYVGGRWIFASFSGEITPRLLSWLKETALHGATEFVLAPSFASYISGELPQISVQIRKPGRSITGAVDGECKVSISYGPAFPNVKQSGAGEMVIPMATKGDVALGSAIARSAKPFVPSHYEVEATIFVKSPITQSGTMLVRRTGFWVMDQTLLTNGKPLTAGKDYFLRDGEQYPITGTTFMSNETHRRFLLEPTSLDWEREFWEMNRAGINMVRTGIWTGWSKHLNDDGTVKESVLRAMDAFLLTAHNYDIPIIFTFFAFLPEQWSGQNVFLDPKSVDAQKAFVRTFVERYKNVNDLLWDFINEPSFCNPKQLWNCRPNYDAFELAAWRQWLKDRYPADSDSARVDRLCEIYRCAPGEAMELPKLEDFDDMNIFEGRHPVKVIDYRLFAQEMFKKWLKEMTSVVRTYGNPHQLVTVGQDEGGCADRPAPQFWGDAADFTCIHNWWANDELVWDTVMTKIPGKLNLVEETGVMFYEKMDSSGWRTEQEVSNLLERKLAISFGSGGAGFIEWLWNANYYMPSDNEAGIGLHRPDGTRKPECTPVIEFAKFFDANKSLMTGRVTEDVVMIIPHSEMFSTRDFATEATRKCVRAMIYDCHIPMRALSEYRMDLLTGVPKIIVVPSPRTLNDSCWKKLVECATNGSVVVISGPIDRDDHWLPILRMAKLGLRIETKPAMRDEYLSIEGKEYRLEYRDDKLQRVEKAVINGNSMATVAAIQQGKGKIIWCPLPIELSDALDPIVEFYSYALRVAGVYPSFTIDKSDDSLVILANTYDTSILYTVISESDTDAVVTIHDIKSGAAITVSVPAQRTANLFVNRSDGKVIAKL